MPTLQVHFIAARTVVRILLVVLAGGLLSGCGSSSSLDRPTAGKTISYAPGLPNFDMELIPSKQAGTPGVDLVVAIPYRSLIYVRTGEAYTADFELTAQILDGAGEYILETVNWRDSVVVADYGRTRAFERHPVRKRITLPNGEYVFRVVLRDHNSDQRIVRTTRVTVPAYGAGKPLLGHLFMERIQRGDSRRVVSLHVPSNFDTLRAVTELYNADGYEEIEVRLAVIRFETDGEIASPPFWITPYAGSLQYRGVDYGEKDTVSTARYTLENLSDQALLTFQLPDLERGIYRVDVTAYLRKITSEADSVVLRNSRDLSVKGFDFPTVAVLDEVVDALGYIARKRELTRINKVDDLEEKRRRFDAFWGELVGERSTAKRLLSRYYSRVEEANLFFTSHKAGWKTDRGMVYVVMGAPRYVERYFDAEIWYYSYSEDPLERFVFKRVNRYHPEGSVRFNNFLLLRRPYYERPWQRAIRNWRNGTIL